MGVHTWLSKVNITFKMQCMYNRKEKMNASLQHLDGEDHTWREFHLGDLSIASMDLFSMGEIHKRNFERWLIFPSGY